MSLPTSFSQYLFFSTHQYPTWGSPGPVWESPPRGPSFPCSWQRSLCSSELFSSAWSYLYLPLVILPPRIVQNSEHYKLRKALYISHFAALFWSFHLVLPMFLSIFKRFEYELLIRVCHIRRPMREKVYVTGRLQYWIKEMYFKNDDGEAIQTFVFQTLPLYESNKQELCYLDNQVLTHYDYLSAIMVWIIFLILNKGGNGIYPTWENFETLLPHFALLV